MKSATCDTAALLSANALYILEKRYLARDGRGRLVESPCDMFRRVARSVAGAELQYDRNADTGAWEEAFYGAMARLEFLPNSPTLLNAGRLSGQLSSCFVLPVHDSDIGRSVREALLVHRSGGGTGFNLSHVPQRGRDGGGPVSFLAPLSTATAAIKQGGIRQGCNIAILDVHHPDIVDFIRAKNSPGELANFYLSVGVTAEFMQAVKSGRDYRLIDPANGETSGYQSAREVFDRIVTQTWKTGDPGLIFLDRIQADNTVPCLGMIEGVSGCGEQALLPYESCNLGSINLSRMLTGDRKPQIDYDKLASTIRLAVRFLDNVIDINQYPLPQIAEATLKTRKIGLGVMGFADMLVRMGIPYDSDRAIETAEAVMGFINGEAHGTSAALAAERGPFPTFADSLYDRPGGGPLRNASCTTIAPTGTISLIAGCSNGIEPLFALVYMRRVMGGKNLLEVNEEFVNQARERGFYSDEMLLELSRAIKASALPGIPHEVKRLFIPAPEIQPSWHVRMQAAFQHHVDSGVSKTVNLPHEATMQDVAEIYMQAHEAGLKGITIYRDGSHPGQPLSGDIGPELMHKYLERS